MQAKTTFTGRARRRSTDPWVRAGDRLARLLITMGGIGTIVAVLLVGVFLLAVALPLFRTASAGPGRSAALDGRGVVAVGMDESGTVAWLLDGGRQGVRVMGLADGATLLERSAADCGLQGSTVIRVLSTGMLASVGREDGSFSTGRLGLESAFLAAGDLPADVAPPGPGEAARLEDGIVVRAAGGQFARLRLVTEFDGHAAEPLPGRIIDIDVTPLASGPLVAAIDDEGRVRLEAATSKRNMLTGKTARVAVGATIEPTAGFKPRFVRVSELGDQMLLVATDGAARRYLIRDVAAPVAMETFDVAPGTANVTALERLFGGVAFAVADSSGDVRILFASRSSDAAAADGLRMAVARTFPGGKDAAAVTAIAASPRSRLFAVGEANGAVRLLHSTTGAAPLAVRSTEAGDAGLEASGSAPESPMVLCIAPRENRLLAAGGHGLAAWSIDTGYPEVSFGTLMLPMWYENYPGPVHAWETTGHEAFESKFGLVPLIFGTIKATLYSLLFATPIALLAAIYASQFMHPAWKARIKPTIEMMASLPSVVLGFIAGLVFAPLLEEALMPVIAGLFAVPLAVLFAAHVWQLLPAGWRGRLAPWRLAAVGFVALPLGVVGARLAAPWMEQMLFQGDVRDWLDGRGGSGFGGWMLAALPLAAVVATTVVGRLVNPWLRRSSGCWGERQAALVSLGVFLAGAIAALALAAAAALFFDALRLDTRGGLFGTYVQRNALVVAVGMSFAIIPLVFTIADDALSSVPEHLRSASLGAGATPWQTAVRVIIPSAASGLFSAVMIGLGRAVGETMIVLMAAGNTPLIGWNVFNGFQTLSAAIATELPEAARGSAHYRVLFLAALALFAITFVVNTAAELVRQRFRRRAHEL
jgi:phosphate transport system permease protein